MLNPVDTFRVADAFERCERLRNKALETIERARQMRSESVEMRLRAAQIRADRKQWLALRRSEDIASRPATPGTLPPGGTTPAVRLTTLAAFVHARLDEEEASADLFHRADCPAPRAPGDSGRPRCDCRTPRRMHQQIADRRSIAHSSEAVIREADHTAPNWPHNEISALQDLQTLALAYELHHLWQEEWRP
ncbi:DUF6221 family protein [Streptomyces sp. NPDC046925]|uniref:DUF6221 family protein n=1 Tax=Streptomyces sp. NPDC046925 TaxID=3155375 RepID=UPI00340B0DE8